MKLLKHTLVIGTGLLVFAGIPAIYYRTPLLAVYGNNVDAVSGASLAVPDQPSGEFMILINRALHTDTLDEWKAFFNEEPVGVIFEDIRCLTAEGDAGGAQLAERYRIRLPENQMTVKSENGLMAVSKASYGIFDVMVLSKEVGDIYNIKTLLDNPDIEFITVTDSEETGKIYSQRQSKKNFVVDYNM